MSLKQRNWFDVLKSSGVPGEVRGIIFKHLSIESISTGCELRYKIFSSNEFSSLLFLKSGVTYFDTIEEVSLKKNSLWVPYSYYFVGNFFVFANI